MPYQQPTAQPLNGYGAAVGPQLSDDQFLQWGQTAQPANQYTDPMTYQSTNSVPSSTNQLTRRPMSQIVTRARQQDNTNNMWHEGTSSSNGNSMPQPVDSAWSDDLEDLERRAAVAQKEAQGKRKQIPPFVQKLNR